MRLFYLIIACLGMVELSAQSLRGLVRDAKTREPLPFLTIVNAADRLQGFTSDAAGYFELKASDSIQELRFSYVGYETRTYRLRARDWAKGKVVIDMQPSASRLQEIEVVAGENPALRIIREAARRRRSNNPQSRRSYRYLAYNKLIADVVIADPSDSSETGFRLENYQGEPSHLYLMESLTEHQYKKPNLESKRVKAMRVAGFEQPEFAIAFATLHPFSFYEDYFTILSRNYRNPISRGSASVYYFRLAEDTLYQGKDTIYIIHFRPKERQQHQGAKGILYISTNNYALQYVAAQSTDKSLIRFDIQQAYHYVGRQWFPKNLDYAFRTTSVEAEDAEGATGQILFKGQSIIDSVEVEPEIRRRDFPLEHLVLANDAFTKKESDWQRLRLDTLTQLEYNTYDLVDSIVTELPFRPDDMANGLVDLNFGLLTFRRLSYRLVELFRGNRYEGFRPGFGLQSSRNVSRRFSIGGYGAYGFRDKQFKYGLDLYWDFLPEKDWQLELYHYDDVEAPGQLRYERSAFRQRIYPNWNFLQTNLLVQADRVQKQGLFFHTRWLRHFQVVLGAERGWHAPQYDYWRLGSDGDSSNIFRTLETQAWIRYAPGERRSRLAGKRVVLERGKAPILWLGYARGWDNVLDGAWDYHRLQVGAEWDFRIRFLGRFRLLGQAGYAWGDLPYMKAFSPTATRVNRFSVFVPFAFQGMAPNEFTANRFAQFFYQHEIGLLFRLSEKIQPRLNLLHSMGWGEWTAEQQAAHLGIPVKDMRHFYNESGILIDDLYKTVWADVAYFGLGLGIVYRYGAYHLPNEGDNWSFKFAARFSF